MNNCCVENLERMYDVTDIAWWGKGYVAASPFFLLAPSIFTPATSSRALVGRAVSLSAKMTYKQASSKIHQNKILPDFVDGVRNFEKIASGRLASLAQTHGLHHSKMSERHIRSWWLSLGSIYEQVLLANNFSAKSVRVAGMGMF